jgi:hypothetical protein
MGNNHTVWATICEIESGLYQAIYSNSGSPSAEKALPAYYAASFLSDAKSMFERSARALGFKGITWIDVSAADLVRRIESSPNPRRQSPIRATTLPRIEVTLVPDDIGTDVDNR